MKRTDDEFVAIGQDRVEVVIVVAWNGVLLAG